MKVKAYLKIKRDRMGDSYIPVLSVSKTKPDAQSNEVVTLLNFDIPDTLFDKPMLEANVVVVAPPASAVPTITIEATALVDWMDKK